MQDDLISRKELIEALRKNCGIWKNTTECFIKVIEEQPTAYSVEDVVAELEEESFYAVEYGSVIANYNAIEIVRNGGKE